jgi:virulence-associated protein VagC
MTYRMFLCVWALELSFPLCCILISLQDKAFIVRPSQRKAAELKALGNAHVTTSLEICSNQSANNINKRIDKQQSLRSMGFYSCNAGRRN